MKVALVHDYLVNFGGAERVLSALHNIFPEAPIYTLLADREKTGKYFPKADIRESFLCRLPAFVKAKHRWLLPLMPIAIESFDLSEFDLVISSSSAFAKGVVTRSKTMHICYCHSPARFLWDYHSQYQLDNGFGIFKKTLAYLMAHKLRIWDKASAERVDFWIANSQATKQKIDKYYRKQAAVIYPVRNSVFYEESDKHPAGISNVIYPSLSNLESESFIKEKSVINSPKDYFLVVSRLSPYKKIDLIISSFNKLKLPLVIVGDGSERKKLEKMAESNVKFAGFMPDEELPDYYRNSKAFILANEEDFGLAALEAASFGKPVLAYKKGGALEWMEEGETGEFFEDQTPEILADGVRRILLNVSKYDPAYIKRKADQFSEEKFRTQILDFIKKQVV